MNGKPLRNVPVIHPKINHFWKLETGSQKMDTGNCKMEIGIQKMETRSQKMETGSQKMETRSWKMETRNWKMMPRDQYQPRCPPRTGLGAAPCSQDRLGPRPNILIDNDYYMLLYLYNLYAILNTSIFHFICFLIYFCSYFWVGG